MAQGAGFKVVVRSRKRSSCFSVSDLGVKKECPMLCWHRAFLGEPRRKGLGDCDSLTAQVGCTAVVKSSEWYELDCHILAVCPSVTRAGNVNSLGTGSNGNDSVSGGSSGEPVVARSCSSLGGSQGRSYGDYPEANAVSAVVSDVEC